MILNFQKTHKEAIEPKKGTIGAAGFDLHTIEGKIIKAKNSSSFETGISFAIPAGYYGKVCSRSGLSFKNDIEVGAGVVDSDYRGSISVKLYNHGNNDLEIKKFDRIAQIVFIKIGLFELKECENLDKTERGENGFGSTGISKDKD